MFQMKRFAPVTSGWPISRLWGGGCIRSGDLQGSGQSDHGVSGEYKGRAFKKGPVIQAQDISAFLNIGKEHILVMELDPGDIHEDHAAIRIARAAARLWRLWPLKSRKAKTRIWCASWTAFAWEPKSAAASSGYYRCCRLLVDTWGRLLEILVENGLDPANSGMALR